MTGRKDCITDRKRTYKTGKKEVFLKQVLRMQKLKDCERSTMNCENTGEHTGLHNYKNHKNYMHIFEQKITLA